MKHPTWVEYRSFQAHDKQKSMTRARVNAHQNDRKTEILEIKITFLILCRKLLRETRDFFLTSFNFFNFNNCCFCSWLHLTLLPLYFLKKWDESLDFPWSGLLRFNITSNKYVLNLEIPRQNSPLLIIYCENFLALKKDKCTSVQVSTIDTLCKRSVSPIIS